MRSRARLELFVVSVLALWLELALIRWLGSEVRALAFFKNFVLIAAFAGFGIGFATAGAKDALARSSLVCAGLVVLVSQLLEVRFGPAIVSEALSNMAGFVSWFDRPDRATDLGILVAGLAWTVALFVGIVLVFVGWGRRTGAAIEAVVAAAPPEGAGAARLEGYSLNVAGSLAGILLFTAASALALPPVTWFGPALLLALPLVQGRARWLVACSALAVSAGLWPVAEVTWSPYQKLEWRAWDGSVRVNGTAYMVLRSLDRYYDAAERAGLDRWRLPHRLRPGAASVLVVGAGSGNDVSAALRAGARRVVAVEIDPAIVAIARAHHPDHPYDDPRVELVVDDARHVAETTPERFDLIVFGHLDAHMTLSAFTNVRLDNYVHTEESFQAFRRLLAPGGCLFVSFMATQPWVAAHLEENLRLAFEAPPVSLSTRFQDGVGVSAVFVAASDPAALAPARALRAAGVGEDVPAVAAPLPTTDDWPYLFVESRGVPIPMRWMVAITALIGAATVLAGLGRGRAWRDAGRGELHLALLGAAFLLVEVHNVGRLARVFGTTWVVNAWVIGGVLLVALLGNALVAWRAASLPKALVFAPLVLGVLAGAFVPLDPVLALPGGRLLAVGLYTLPLLFAGVAFARAFRLAPDPGRALAANVLGAVLGGLLEVTSFVTGLSGLLVVAAALYAAGWASAPARDAP